MRRVVAAFAIVLASLVVAAPAALAGGDGYTPTNIGVQVNGDGSLTITGENCRPNGPVSYVVRRIGDASSIVARASQGIGEIVAQGTGVNDSQGRFRFDTTVLPPGRYRVEVTCGVATNSAEVRIGARTGPLASTGADSTLPLVRIGAVLVASGGLAAYAAKRRRERADAVTG